MAVGPPTLFESELFGHRAGAFTGATADRVGRVERAAGGTLVLDHVEEMPLAAQAKLLRLVAEGRYAPVGGDELAADVRFMAIAAADLEQRVESGAFREDLFYRLEVLTVRLPPLRRRRADLDALIDTLLDDLGQRFRRPGLELAPAARRWMARYPWPGNLRELRNLLERAVLSQGTAVLDPSPPGGDAGRPRTLAEVERREIERALAWARGHQGRAAELLGISRKTLWQKRRRYACRETGPPRRRGADPGGADGAPGGAGAAGDAADGSDAQRRARPGGAVRRAGGPRVLAG